MFSLSPSWKALFRVPHDVLTLLTAGLATNITRATTNYKKPIPANIKVAAFLMYMSNATCEAVASQLGIGASSVSSIVKGVSREICSQFHDCVHFPKEEGDLASVMKGFEKIAGLPYCCGAVDGSHIKWLA